MEGQEEQEMKDAHTTIAGIAAALGVLGHAISEIVKDGWQPADLGLLIASIGIAMTAYLAKDAERSDDGKAE